MAHGNLEYTGPVNQTIWAIFSCKIIIQFITTFFIFLFNRRNSIKLLAIDVEKLISEMARSSSLSRKIMHTQLKHPKKSITLSPKLNQSFT